VPFSRRPRGGSERERTPLPDDPQWYKDAIIYEIQVRAFFDSNADGIGDFRGLIQKLDYVRDLGVTAIWLTPFYPSPHKDGGYDISDYHAVHPPYGTLEDFARFMDEAHRRGLRVITELVINHTSDRHAWFERARKSPRGSSQRDFYVWSDDPGRYAGVRVIFPDYEASNWTWDRVAGQYYWHRFYSHQPDLNFDNPDVHTAIFSVVDFWLDLGVDGMRLDAIPYLYEREGTNCENVPETHAFLKRLRAHIDGKYKNRMLLAEANQWPEDAAAYFANGDECHMNFHFPLMPRMFISQKLESSFPIVDILQQTPPIPDGCQWAIFLRNHDELTLEMVTDEDRDFMYAVYAEDPQMRVNVGIRRRLAPLMRTRARIELMNALLFSMPGTPVVYYGDEIGMGDNIYLGDRDAMRTPMQWSADKNAGFSTGNPQRLFLPPITDPEFHHTTVNVEAQAGNPESLLAWTRRIVLLRRQHRVFGRGGLELLNADNGKVLAFFRYDGEERILVAANLGRTPQHVELDLAEYAGIVPLELFGATPFPRIGERPYSLTFGPHGFYWFSLAREGDEDRRGPMWIAESWAESLEGRARARLERAIAIWIRPRRWFRGKSRALTSLEIYECLHAGDARILFTTVRYADGGSERYSVPIAHASGEEAERIRWSAPGALIGEVDGGIVYDATASHEFADLLLRSANESVTLRGAQGFLRARTTPLFPEQIDRSLTPRCERDHHQIASTPEAGTAEQSNTHIVFGERLVLKLFRVIEPGEHPEAEISRHLTEVASFPHVPRLAGSITYESGEGPPFAFGVLEEFVPNQGDTWTAALDAVQRYLENVRALPRGAVPPIDTLGFTERSARPVPPIARDTIGAFLGMARLLGERTAELHLALALPTEDPVFNAVDFTMLHQRSLYQSARALLGKTVEDLRLQLRSLPEPARSLAELAIERRGDIDRRLARIRDVEIDAVRVRTHGDFHLGQVLVRGGDLVFIDFEGEPARSLAERRRKRSPVRDLAGLLRSLSYATAVVLESPRVRREDVPALAPWADAWVAWVGAAFLAAWRERAGAAAFVPRNERAFSTLLDFHLLEKCVYEVRYELDHRPDWVSIPLRGLLRLSEA
jgi:maltose alpha-D-glucosyltransferase/alpha-amylase